MGLYISKWWGNYVGGCDDSFLLLDYLDKYSEGKRLNEMLVDLHIDTLLRTNTIHTGDAYFKVNDDYEPHFDIPVNVIIDLAAILVESLKNGELDMTLVSGGLGHSRRLVISADKEDILLVKNGLDEFINNPSKYDLYNLMDENEIEELLNDCKQISHEIAGYI